MGSFRLYLWIAAGVIAAVYLTRGFVSPKTKSSHYYYYALLLFTLIFDWYLKSSTNKGLEERAMCSLFETQLYCRTVDTEENNDEGENLTDSLPVSPRGGDVDELPIVTKKKINFCDSKFVIPPVYRTENQTVVVAPASIEYVSIPATFETVVVKYLVKPSHNEGAIFEADNQSFIIQEAGIELVTIPAVWETSERTFSFPISGEIGTYTYRVVKTPPRTVERVIPAIIGTFQIERLVREGPRTNPIIQPTEQPFRKRVVKTPAQVVERVLPAVTKTFSNRYLVKAGNSSEIIEVCNLENEPELKVDVALKLRELGFLAEKAGAETEDGIALAIGKFQLRNKLKSSGTLTRETLQALEISYQ